MATITRTHTKTYALLSAWASTFPWDCLVNVPTRCCSKTHDHGALVGDICAAPQCDEPLRIDEECYLVTEPGIDTAVCWRHVRPDDGAIVVSP
jgi:hypothetical protein